MKYFIFLIFLIFLFASINAFSNQNVQQDSINHIFKSNVHDTLKVQKLIKLANENNSESYIDQAYKTLLSIDNNEEKIVAINAIGEYYLANNQYQKAIDFYSLFKEVYYSLGNYLQVSVAYRNLGLLYKIIGVYDQSLDCYKKSLEIDLILGNKERIAYEYGSVGNLYKKLSNFEKALDYYQKALQLNEELGIESGIAYTCNGLGSIFSELGKYDKSITYYQKALVINEKIDNKKGIIYSNASIGDIYKRLNNFEKAIEYNEKALQLSHEIGAKSSKAHALSNLGYIYKEKYEYQKSLSYFKESLAINQEKKLVKPTSLILSEIGFIYAEIGNIQEALEYGHEGLVIAQNIQSINELSVAYSNLSHTYKKAGNYKKAFDFQVLYSETKDSIYSIASAEKLAEMQTRFETERKEKENKILKQEQIINDIKLHRQHNISIAISLMLIIVIIFVIFLYRAYEHKRKVNVLLLKQKEEIDKQAQELELANKEISKKNSDITDSIAYAKRIQDAMMPAFANLNELFDDSFFIYLPKDIVSGDFLWYSYLREKIIIATADCTGHGVPGAFMSLIGISFLNKIVNEKGITDPSEILNRLRKNIMNSLHKTGKPGESTDGMDISIIVIDKPNQKIEFSSAMNPIYLIRNNMLKEFVADKMPIGMYELLNKAYSKLTIDYENGDQIYLFSDGYADQFGGKRKNKLKYHNFKKILIGNSQQSMEIQKNKLIQTFEDWKGDNEQVDDILIVGIKL